jgi:release factor glutamine methyltransferase
MLIKELKKRFLEDLSVWNDPMETESMFYIVLQKLHHLKRIDLALQPDLKISDLDTKRWENIVAELQTQKPIQYILGETEFFGLLFQVNENTLIPRQETEELVDLILAQIKNKNLKNLKIIDIGTGSGCIAISLAKNSLDSNVFALDVSEKALEIAKINAKQNRVEVHFIREDILGIENLNDLEITASENENAFDIIVSNPPYVRNLEKHEIRPNVLEFEPHLALFVDDTDALLFYRKIGQLAFRNLTENGRLFFEINQYLGLETKELLHKIGFNNVQLIKDIYGNDRIIYAMKN